MDDFFHGVDEAVQTLNLASTGESLSELLALSRELVSALDPNQALLALGEAVRQLVGGDRFVILRSGPEGQLQSILARDDHKRDLPLPALDVPLQACKRAMADNVVAFVTSPQATEPWDKLSDVGTLMISGFLVLPLTAPGQDGRLPMQRGCVYVDSISPFPKTIDEATIDVLRLLGQHAVLAIDNAQVLEQVARDGASEVHSAAYFERRLREEYGRALRYRRPFSLILIDVEDAEALVVKYGQAGLDHTIAQIGLAIRSECRDSDVVARLAPARFAVLLPEMNVLDNSTVSVSLPAPSLFAARLRTRIAESSVIIQGVPQSVKITTAGVVYAQPPVVTPNAVLHDAEAALDLAHKSGQDQYVVR